MDVSGVRLGSYEVLRPLGEGGMAQVYLAVRRGAGGFEKKVALKLLHSRYLGESDFRSMFLDEARILARLHHPNVVNVFEAECIDGVPFLAMEYVHGPTLNALQRAAIKANSNPLGYWLHLVRQVCEGLHAAHTLQSDGVPLGIVHRDLSTQNVLVDAATGAAKLIDFGIAKLADPLHEPTRTGILKGKLHYVAPEVQAGAPYDARADVYAVGVLLYRFAAGRMPYRESDLQSADRPPPYLPIEKVKGLPPGVAELVNRAMAHRPEDRFASAAEVAAELKRILERIRIDPDEIPPWIGGLFPNGEQDWAARAESQDGAHHATLHRLIDRRRAATKLARGWRVAATAGLAASVLAVAALTLGVELRSGPDREARTYLDAADALLAGGHPDQAADLNARAAPTDPELVVRAAKQRARIEDASGR